MWPVVRNRFKLAFLDFVMGDSARWLHNWTVIVSTVVNLHSPHSRRTARNDHERTVHEAGRTLALARLLGQTIARTVSATTITAEPDLCNATRLLVVGNGGCLDYNIIPVLFAMSLDSFNEGILVWIGYFWRRDEVSRQLSIVLHVIGYIHGEVGGVSHYHRRGLIGLSRGRMVLLTNFRSARHLA